jgi:hypothetical protein
MDTGEGRTVMGLRDRRLVNGMAGDKQLTAPTRYRPTATHSTHIIHAPALASEDVDHADAVDEGHLLQRLPQRPQVVHARVRNARVLGLR